jgi:hypothetical protein
MAAMLTALQRLLHRGQSEPIDLSWLDGWVHRRGDRLKRVRGGEGFVIEGAHDGHVLRIEWGPPQRDYLRAAELRVRWELGLPLGMEMLVITRGLADLLEAEAYDCLTMDQQTAVDTALPEEARWLAMYEHLPAETLPAGVQSHYMVVSSQLPWAEQWIDGDLGTRLARAPARWLGDTPLVLMTLRGRLYMRTEAAMLDEAFMDGLRGLAEAASQRALQLAASGPLPRRSRSLEKEG